MARPWEIWTRGRAKGYQEWFGEPPKPNDAHAGRMELALSLIEGRSVLDAGCGVGHFYPYAKRNGLEYTGVDTSDDMLMEAQCWFPEGDFRFGDIFNLSSAPVRDTVVSQSVLIHLPEIFNPIRQMWSRAEMALVFSIPLSNTPQVNKYEKIGDKYLLAHSEPLTTIMGLCKSLPNSGEITHVLEPGSKIRNTYFKVLRER